MPIDYKHYLLMAMFASLIYKFGKIQLMSKDLIEQYQFYFPLFEQACSLFFALCSIQTVISRLFINICNNFSVRQIIHQLRIVDQNNLQFQNLLFILFSCQIYRIQPNTKIMITSSKFFQKTFFPVEQAETPHFRNPHKKEDLSPWLEGIKKSLNEEQQQNSSYKNIQSTKLKKYLNANLKNLEVDLNYYQQKNPQYKQFPLKTNNLSIDFSKRYVRTLEPIDTKKQLTNGSTNLQLQKSRQQLMFPKLDIKQYFQIHGKGKPFEQEQIVRRRKYRRKLFEQLNINKDSQINRNKKKLSSSRKQMQCQSMRNRYMISIQSPQLGVIGIKTHKKEY